MSSNGSGGSTVIVIADDGHDTDSGKKSCTILHWKESDTPFPLFISSESGRAQISCLFFSHENKTNGPFNPLIVNGDKIYGL